MSAPNAAVPENQSEPAPVDSALAPSSANSDRYLPLRVQATHERFPATKARTMPPNDICFAHRLPNEMLCLIFLEWRQLNALSSLVASHVCRRWRNVATSSPLLWTALVVEGRTDSDTRKRDAHNAALWMARSQGRLYNLRIDPRHIFHHEQSLALPPLLYSCIDSLVDLQVSKFDEQNVNEFMAEHGPKFSYRLDVLQIHGPEIRSRTTPPTLVPFLDLPGMVSLKHLGLRTVRLSPEPLPYGRLKSLRLQFPSSQEDADHPLELLRRIRFLSSLEDLSLTSDTTTDVLSERLVTSAGGGLRSQVRSRRYAFRATFPLLRRLELKGAAHWDQFVDRVSVPALQGLELEGCANLKISKLLDSLDLLSSPLARLELRKPGYLENELASRLRHISSLVHLVITCSPNLSDAFVECLLDASSSPWLTKLETLDFSGSRGVTGEGLVRAMRSHLAPSGIVFDAAATLANQSVPTGVKRIKHLRLLDCPKVDEGAITKLAELVPLVTSLPPSSSRSDDERGDDCDAFSAGRNY